MDANVQSGDDIKGLVEPLYRAKFWLQLVGVMLIIGGLLTALSIVGILICWIPIWAGISLMQAAGSISEAYSSGSGEAAGMAMRRLKTYFTIFGILTLVYIIFAVIGFVFVGTGAMMGAMSGAA